MVESINSLPDAYSGTCTSVINDKDEAIVTRNLVMLLLAMTLPPNEAAEVILHVWYSARLTPTMHEKIRLTVRPLISDVWEKIKGKDNNVILSKTWVFSKRELSARLYKEQWHTIQKTLDAEYPISETEKARRYVTLNETRVDHRDRHFFNLSPSKRVCSYNMRHRGVLLPFGTSSEQYTCSNPSEFLFSRANELG